MRPVAVAVAGSVIWLTALLTAQQSQSPPPRFRGGVELVQFDVAVLDRNRKPVQGVEVPDFRRQRLSLSGVALGRRGRVALPADGLSAVLPTVPSAERTFAPTDRVSGFVRIYQQSGGRPVTASLTAAVLDSSDKVVTEHTTSIESGRFEPVRAADFHFELPLANLVPGNYLLRLDATAGLNTTTRGARFSVR